MIKEPRISLFEVVMGVSNAIDLISPVIVDHHKRVAYIALGLADEFGLSIEEQNNLIFAGLLHDSGAITLEERLDILSFELKKPYKHAEIGYLLFKDFKPLSNIALPIRYHHTYWNEGQGKNIKNEEVPIYSHILHLADRVSVLIKGQRELLGQVKDISVKIEEQSGRMFMPKLVEVFKILARKEYFWFDITTSQISTLLKNRAGLVTVEINMHELLNLAKLFCQIIDFRSRFTATHSSGVAATAETLAKLIGFSEREAQMIKIAGYLHDLGKLAVPTKILEKPTKLTDEEFNIIKSHTFHTYRTLEVISNFEIINSWASFHHERLDGTGYPFHYKSKDLSLGSRIMAVADVFTAVTEDRPYRKGMNKDMTIQVLKQMADANTLDATIVSLLINNYDEIFSIRSSAQIEAAKEYLAFEQRSAIIN